MILLYPAYSLERLLGQFDDERNRHLRRPRVDVRPGEALCRSATNPHHLLSLERLHQPGLLDVQLRSVAHLPVLVFAPSVHLPLVGQRHHVTHSQADRHDALLAQCLHHFGKPDVLLGRMAQLPALPLAPREHLAVDSEGDAELRPAVNLRHVDVLQFLHQTGQLGAVRTAATQLPVVAVAPTVHSPLGGDAQRVGIERAARHFHDVLVRQGGDHGRDEAVFGGAVSQAAVVAPSPSVQSAVR
jgi:hypothetical protein